MPFQRENLISSVVTRMRLGWFVISALLVLVVAASVFGLKNVQATQNALSERAIPALERFETVSDELSSFQANVGALTLAQDADALRQEASRAAESLERLDALLLDTDEIQGVVGAMGSSVQELDRIGQLKLRNRGDLARLAAHAEALGLQLSETISLQIIDDGAFLETAVLTGGANGNLPDAIIRHLSELNTLTQLGSAITTAIEKVELLLSTPTLIQLRELEERLGFEFRGAVGDLILLPKSQFQQELASLIAGLRNAILDEGGLVVLQKQRLTIAAAQDQELRNVHDLLARTSELVSSSVAQSKEGIDEAANLIDATVAKTMSQLFVLGAAIMLVISLTTIYLIERQVIRRLRILTRSVREIASGNNDWKVTVDGTDEFGEMASALEVFKGNSKELHRSNEELGRFAYAASHDLKSPLRAIHDLAQWTIEDAGDVLPDECRGHLDMMMDRTGRLSRLLDSLLEYSRVGRENSTIASVDLDWLPQDILDLLGARDRFALKIEGDMKTAMTYEAPFRQVLYNFINNAIKHHDKEHGEITVSCRRLGDRLQVSVADDGPGIDPQYHEKIFELFQTLQSRDNVEGSGMGLAIIRKQVEQYGGTLSLNSDPGRGRGSVFTFDWPLVEERNVIEFAA